MWMARGQQETRLQEPGAEWGEVTLSGDTVGVSLAGERRRVRVCLPGGYHWVPDRGETVLVQLPWLLSIRWNSVRKRSGKSRPVSVTIAAPMPSLSAPSIVRTSIPCSASVRLMAAVKT